MLEYWSDKATCGGSIHGNFTIVDGIDEEEKLIEKIKSPSIELLKDADREATKRGMKMQVQTVNECNYHQVQGQKIEGTANLPMPFEQCFLH
jgi:hypothetical protein